MVDFYQNKLGFKKIVLVKYGEYLNCPDKPQQQKIAQADPDRIMYGYFEVCPGQFIEMFPKDTAQVDDVAWKVVLVLITLLLQLMIFRPLFKNLKRREFL